jgi:hypothetical protein
LPGEKKERITVYVDGRPVQLYRGMKVRHALVSIESSLCAAVEEGGISVRDANGFEVGLDGALDDGCRLVLKKSG